MRAAFVDSSKAFDLVNHEVLWAVLEAQGFHPRLIRLIKDLYEGNRVRQGTSSSLSGLSSALA